MLQRFLRATFKVRLLELLILCAGAVFIAFQVSASILAQTVTNPTWTSTGSMNSPRLTFGLTLLSDGKVLAAGGFSDNGIGNNGLVDFTEIYDPSTGQWSKTGNLNTPRRMDNDGLVTLKNGKALIAAGTAEDFSYDIASAELYDPSTGIWSYTGSLNTSRRTASVTLLKDGRVLAAGGAHGGPNSGRFLSSAEIYDPNTGTWSYTGSLHIPREGHNAILLKDGRVLVGGGETPTVSASRDLEIYDPANGTWTMVGTTPWGWLFATANMAVLPDGSVLIAGGYGDGIGHTDAVIFNPVNNSVIRVASMPYSTVQTRAVVLDDGRVLIAGNYDNTHTVSQLYDPATQSWTTSAGPTTIVRGLKAKLLNGKVLAAGEYTQLPNNAPVSANAELFSLSTISPANQTISFTQPAFNYFPYPAGDTTFSVAAIASSGLPVSFSATGVCNINGSTVSVTGIGICIVTASQNGNANYNPAQPISRSFQIVPNPTGYALLSLGPTSLTSTQIQGPVAAFGNSTFMGTNINYGGSGSNAIVVQGNVSFGNWGNTANGNVTYSGSILDRFVTFARGGFVTNPTALPVALKDYTLKVSDAWANLTTNGTVTYTQWGQIILSGSNQTRNVFLVDGAKLSAANNLIIQTPSNVPVIINVSGTNDKLQNLGTNLVGPGEGSIAFNFYEATTLNINSVGVRGTIWSPRALVTFRSASIKGSIIAGSMTDNSGGYQSAPFEGTLPAVQ